MNIFHRFFGSRPPASTHIETKQYCIVDANGFIEKRFREANGQPNPRDNFIVLKNLANFVYREDIKLTAVFIGRPLREAGEGKLFKGVTVFYTNDEKSLSKKIIQLAKSGSSHNKPVIITDDRNTEQEAVKTGSQCMRLTTFKKSMGGGFDHDRQPQRHMQKRSTTEAQPRHQPTEQKVPAESDKENKNVLDLIDPV
ncbi:NYN domain-containing protein [Verrucomicrobiota bacterium]